MAINCIQLRDVVIRPALQAIGYLSDDAVALLLGTCAQETQLGRYLIQTSIGFKGGIGIYQIETPSYHDVWNNCVEPFPSMRAKLQIYLGYAGKPQSARMATDLSLATIMCRLYYSRIKEPLPKADDLPAMAAYYKRYYNTPKGKATEQQFIDNYKALVTC